MLHVSEDPHLGERQEEHKTVSIALYLRKAKEKLRLTWCVSLYVPFDHLIHKIPQRGVRGAGVIVRLAVTATDENKNGYRIIHKP